MNNENKTVTFGKVECLQFDRAQGFETVPDKGGASLSMNLKHFDSYSMNATYYSRISFLKRYFNSSVLPDSVFPSTPPCLSPQVSMSEEISCATLPQLDAPETDNILNIKCPHEEEEDCDCYSISTSTGRTLKSKEKLKAVSLRNRIKILKEAGVKIDDKERLVCSKLRESRKNVGCNCLNGVCNPETCSCSLNEIPCQMDKLNFPCSCNPNTCSNVNGRVEYSYQRVKNHFLHTIRNGTNKTCILSGTCLECTKNDYEENLKIKLPNRRLAKYPTKNNIHSCQQCITEADSLQNSKDALNSEIFYSIEEGDEEEAVQSSPQTTFHDANDFHNLSSIPIINPYNKELPVTPFLAPSTSKLSNLSYLHEKTSSLNRLSLRKRKIPKTPLSSYLKDFSTPFREKKNNASSSATISHISFGKSINFPIQTHSESNPVILDLPKNQTQTPIRTSIKRFRSPSAEGVKVQRVQSPTNTSKKKSTPNIFSAPSSPTISYN